MCIYVHGVCVNSSRISHHPAFGTDWPKTIVHSTGSLWHSEFIQSAQSNHTSTQTKSGESISHPQLTHPLPILSHPPNIHTIITFILSQTPISSPPHSFLQIIIVTEHYRSYCNTPLFCPPQTLIPSSLYTPFMSDISLNKSHLRTTSH